MWGFRIQSPNSSFTSCVAHNNTAHGFLAEGSNVAFTSNTAYNNSDAGFFVMASSISSNSNDLAYGNQYGFRATYSNSTFASCTARYNNASGFYSDHSNSTVISSTAHNNTYGLYLTFSESILTNNNVYNNSNNGVYLDFSPSSVLTNNTARNNKGSGFHSYSSTANFTNNTAYSNDYVGFGSDSSTSRYTGNTAYNNQDGLSASSSTLLYTNNTAHDNSRYGVFIASSDPNITRLIAYNNLEGIRLDSSSGLSTISSSWFYNNSKSVVAYVGGVQWPLSIINIKLNYSSVNISMNDIVNSSYYINETYVNYTAPEGYTLFHDKYILFSNPVNDSNLSFHWSDLEASGYEESAISVFCLNITDGTWDTVQNQSVNTGANTLTVTSFDSVSAPGIFGLFVGELQEEEETDDDDGDNDQEQSLSLDVTTQESGNIATVIDEDGKPVSDAHILVDGFVVCYTGNNGQCKFEGCGETVLVEATKPSYEPDELTVILEDCASEDDTGGTDCGCGIIENQECIPYDCCWDSDCNEGQVCLDNTCEVPVECESDSDCDETEYCDDGICMLVEGECGYVTNHTFVSYSYECGTEDGCPACSEGVCVSHSCIVFGLMCSNGVVGSTSSCNATQDADACANCGYMVVTPDGTVITGTADASGNFTISLNLVGIYNISLAEGGETVQVISTQLNNADDDTKPTITSEDNTCLLSLLILLLLAICLYFYWRNRGEKKK
jgi:parallel beta-helix repeat protein